MKAWILGGIGIVLVLLIGLGTGLFLAGALDSGDSAEENGEEAVEGEAERQPPIYHSIDPAFVVNVEAERRVRYLQLKVELMTRDQATVDAVERHMPRVRNRLLMLFSDVEFEKVRSSEGREALQEASRQAIISLLEEEEEPAEIEALFFTNFVMQ